MELTILIAVVIMLLFAAAVLYLVFFRRKEGAAAPRTPRISIENRSATLKAANRRLSQNPKDPNALQNLATIYYTEGDFEKANKYFDTLVGLCATHPELDEADITLKRAICAKNMGDNSQAHKDLLVAKGLSPDGFEVNFHLGHMEFKKKSYEKASALLALARKRQPDHIQTLRYLGLSLFRIRRFDQAIKALRDALAYEPNDKETAFALGQCYFEMGRNEEARKIFSRLRADPRIGPHACLFAGTINMNNERLEEAMEDFEIGLRHRGLKLAVENELKYRLALAAYQVQNVERAVQLLREVLEVNPDFKDARQRLNRYQELSQNEFLQTYLIASTSEFVTLCRRIATTYFKRSRTKLVNISVEKEGQVDIVAEVRTSKWEDQVLLRFLRMTGTVGELLVRNFYMRCRDSHIKRGVLVAPGEFSKGAAQFVEARLIELVDKKSLVRVFGRFSAPASRRA